MTALANAREAVPPRRLPLTPAVAEKYRALQGALAGLGSAVTAFSGGIDSSLVAYLAHQALGPRALAVTSGSESLTRDDLGLTGRLAAEWGLAHRIIRTRETENPGYLANPVNRCYFCKTTLYGDLAAIARAEGYAAVLNGINSDDWGDHRPGLLAAQEHGVRAPLSDCGFGKDEIRMLARHLGLTNAEKPQAACLSSRVPYGHAITLPVLKQIEDAERALRELGFAQLRVRHHEDVARIEVPLADFERVLAQRERIDAALRALGYRYVTLDLRGFRSGSLNEGLKGVE
jgi:pyridinium-3,5-biscarboxylic acid mononucleotide sulfurtransferase